MLGICVPARLKGLLPFLPMHTPAMSTVKHEKGNILFTIYLAPLLSPKGEKTGRPYSVYFTLLFATLSNSRDPSADNTYS